jgi:hypothetical protein
MVVRPTVRAEGVREVLAELKKLSPDLVKQLRKDLRAGVQPTVKAVVAAYPIAPPLSGMANNGDLRWGRVRGSVSITPGRSRKYRQTSNLVSIKVTGSPDRGLRMVELAGSRSSGSTPQGQNLIAVLNRRRPMRGRGGRFAYDTFRKNRDQAVQVADVIIRKYAAVVSRRLK